MQASRGPERDVAGIGRHRAGMASEQPGIRGAVQLDPIVARHIRNTPAGIISLCLGINVWGSASFSHRSLGPAIVGFIATVRDGHPVTLVVITPIVAPERETTRNGSGLTLRDIRTIVSDVVVGLQERGDDALTLIDGLEILGLDESDLLGDGLHPGPEGYRLMAERLRPRLVAALKQSTPKHSTPKHSTLDDSSRSAP